MAGEFEWDEQKAASNLLKHGISFEWAIGVFYDPFAVEFVDALEDYGEERSLLIGQSGLELLPVAYTEREQKARIISARRATRHERNYYHRANAK